MWVEVMSGGFPGGGEISTGLEKQPRCSKQKEGITFPMEKMA